MKDLEKVILNPPDSVKACVIWLHGLGADGYDFANIVPQLHLANELGIRFIFPHAPLRPVTLNNGYTMRAWFDLYALNPQSKIDTAGIDAMDQALNRLIAEQIADGIPANKIILAGFSQGGAMALVTALRYRERLAGILGLSTFLPPVAALNPQHYPANANTPILLAHGTQDPIVPISWGEATYHYLKKSHYPVTWRTYTMQHEVNWQEIKDIADFLTRCLTDWDLSVG